MRQEPLVTRSIRTTTGRRVSFVLRLSEIPVRVQNSFSRLAFDLDAQRWMAFARLVLRAEQS